MTAHLRTVFMGTPAFGVPTLEALAAHTDLQLVVTQPDRRSGRGKKLQFSPVKQRALELGIEVIGPPVVKGNRFAKKIAGYQPDVLVTAAFGRLLGPSLLAVARYGCLNVHASILPLYRGAAPINWAILNGDTQSGVSIMKTVQQLDAGDIYGVSIVPIDRQTAGELTLQLSQSGAKILIETLAKIERIKPIPQSEDKVTFAPTLSKSDGKMDWHRTATELDCHVRGMHPWPGAFAQWQGEPVKIHQAHVVSLDTSEIPGTVLSQDTNGVVVACGQSALRITALQMPGKKRLEANQFYAGLKFPQGCMLK